MKKSLWVLAAVLALFVAVIFAGCGSKSSDKALEDGTYYANITMDGGTGRSYIESPVKLQVSGGEILAELVWSSKNYDYMVVGGNKYLNESEPGEASVFTIPIESPNCSMTVIGDTTAMSVPHEIEYTLTFEMVEN